VEWWILAGVVLALAGAAGVARLRGRRTRTGKETKNIYPLW
jgi:hypothetical protein